MTGQLIYLIAQQQAHEPDRITTRTIRDQRRARAPFARVGRRFLGRN
jgi:hypothetical protein